MDVQTCAPRPALHQLNLGRLMVFCGRQAIEDLGAPTVSTGRYGDGSWYLELHAFGHFLGFYR